jgi:MFS family permease
MSIGNTVAFFGMRVIQFYADKYMEIVLDVEKEVKFVYFIVLCITGPILGILIVGFIMQKIGGYGSRNGMIFIIVLNVVAAIVSMIFPATLNTFISLASAWVYLFCLAAVSPLQGGVIIASLPKELKGNGYAINMFFLNGIGSFPSSYVFALICDFIRDNYDESNMRYKTTMRIVMLYNFFGLLLIILAGIVRFRIKGDLGVEQKEEGKEEEEKTDNTDENKEEDKEILIGKQE